jgi:hypothetical protein
MSEYYVGANLTALADPTIKGRIKEYGSEGFVVNYGLPRYNLIIRYQNEEAFLTYWSLDPVEPQSGEVWTVTSNGTQVTIIGVVNGYVVSKNDRDFAFTQPLDQFVARAKRGAHERPLPRLIGEASSVFVPVWEGKHPEEDYTVRNMMYTSMEKLKEAKPYRSVGTLEVPLDWTNAKWVKQ